MFVLKFIVKLVLIPVWLMLLIIWLPVHLAALICSLFHGLGKLLFGALALLAMLLGLWQNAAIFIAVIAMTFLLVFSGTVVDVIVEAARKSVGMVIAG